MTGHASGSGRDRSWGERLVSLSVAVEAADGGTAAAVV